MVAKSYQEMNIWGEPYISSGRAYVQVEDPKTGRVRQVRWYTEAEYVKMYPDYEPMPKRTKSQKEILGFTEGYVTIFKGDTYANLEWFQRSIARYCKLWGWYIISTETIPIDLPAGLEPIRLDWSRVGTDEDVLMSEQQVVAAVNELIYDAGTSEYQGEVGERLNLNVKIIRAYDGENYYGRYTVHVFEDENGNEYRWTTNSKSWPEGAIKKIRGTVKEHKVIKNVKTTILTRCSEVK